MVAIPTRFPRKNNFLSLAELGLVICDLCDAQQLALPGNEKRAGSTATSLSI
jgi:hypothetical protein